MQTADRRRLALRDPAITRCPASTPKLDGPLRTDALDVPSEAAPLITADAPLAWPCCPTRSRDARTARVTLSPSDPAGLVGLGDVAIPLEGDHRVSRDCRELSQLFIVNFAGRSSCNGPVGPHP